MANAMTAQESVPVTSTTGAELASARNVQVSILLVVLLENVFALVNWKGNACAITVLQAMPVRRKYVQSVTAVDTAFAIMRLDDVNASRIGSVQAALIETVQMDALVMELANGSSAAVSVPKDGGLPTAVSVLALEITGNHALDTVNATQPMVNANVSVITGAISVRKNAQANALRMVFAIRRQANANVAAGTLGRSVNIKPARTTAMDKGSVISKLVHVSALPGSLDKTVE